MVDWKIGVELELLAPRGSSRRALAEAYGGEVVPFFHPQSETSLVPGMPVFENLTLGFEVRDRATGAPIAKCVDDLTIVDDLERTRPSVPGWFRVVGDDLRLLGLVARHGRADAGMWEAVAPVAALFGTEPEQLDGAVRVTDRNRAPIAIATALPGERERPCEIITPPIERDHAARLEALLAPARALGFTIPAEAAVHVHFDAAPFRDARAFRSLVHVLAPRLDALKRELATNPRCRRLGPWPAALFEVIDAPDFATLTWEAAQERLAEVGLTKYCDVNLKNLVHDVPDKPTIEVRIFPGALDAAPVLAGAARFAALFREALQAP